MSLSHAHSQVFNLFKIKCHDLSDKAENLKSELSDSLILLDDLGQVIYTLSFGCLILKPGKSNPSLFWGHRDVVKEK